MYVPRAMYSFRMSFCTVPDSFFTSAPARPATATYSASRMLAVALIVIDVEMRSSGIPSNNRSISSIESIATPTLPTPPRAYGESESYPICVGKSNATESPAVPCASRNLYRRLLSSASPIPAYCRIVHSRPRYIVGWMPRVNGNSPGNPRSRSGTNSVRSSAVYNGFGLESAVMRTAYCMSAQASAVAHRIPQHGSGSPGEGSQSTSGDGLVSGHEFTRAVTGSEEGMLQPLRRMLHMCGILADGRFRAERVLR